jgi:hypothetical protein
MFRKVCSLILVSALFYSTPIAAAAEPGQPPAAPQTKSRSTGKRVMWTVIGAGAGFGAGLLIGLNQFDDAINSEQKVWISALVGAAAGGLAGGLLSRNVRSTPQSNEHGASTPDPVAVTWQSALAGGSAEDSALRQRLRTSGSGYSCRLNTNVCGR